MRIHIELILPILTAASIGESLGQVYIRAKQSADTYGLINNVLGETAVEVPDCVDKYFGRHIRQQFDNELKRDVFAFHIHVAPDNDRCKKVYKQRVEIKTYNPSAEYLKGREGEVINFSWNFKLDAGFQPSKVFTHIHQLKAVDGDDLMPLITLTPRFASPNRLELIHIDSMGVKTTRKTPLAPFLGEWIHVKEKVTYSTNGKYSIKFTRVREGTEIFTFSTDSIDLWRTGASFIRPKWGIYRSLTKQSQLRDEIILYDTFCLAKGQIIAHNCNF